MIMKKIKEMFDYKKRWKHQKNRAKNYRKRINKLQQGLTEELKLDVTNEEIHKLKLEISRLKKHIISLESEAQKYFDICMDLYEELNYKGGDEDDSTQN